VRETTRFSADAKAELLALVACTRARTGWPVRRILPHLGLSTARYRAWRERAGQGALADRPPVAPALDAILPEEQQAVLTYALAHPKDGYRRLAWQMVDEDVAYLSPSSVYRVLKDADLLYRWKRSARSGAAPAKPERPHERWHTDLMYLRIGDAWYFLVTVLDAYSRYVVHWELLTTMTATDVRLVIQQALEVTGAHPKLVTDNGSQFTAAEFKDLVRRFAVEHIRIRTYHPESNGLVERFHRSTRDALADEALRTLGRARGLIAAWVAEYNERRLHAGLGYLTPADYYRGDPAARRTERAAKLAQGRAERRQRNQERLKRAA
jgi:transposase InsO family protein